MTIRCRHRIIRNMSTKEKMVTATELAKNAGRVLEDVIRGTTVKVERYGRIIAVIAPASAEDTTA